MTVGVSKEQVTPGAQAPWHACGVPDPGDLPFGGSGDARAGGRPLAERFRGHADALVRGERSPLSARLMYAAAEDIDAGGVVAELFDDVATPPGSVPQLRLLGALHRLVLAGDAPALARFYPSAGGRELPGAVWPAAREAMLMNFACVKERLRLTVQTNEPGRSTVLFSALLWLASRYRLPVRLLEIGASAGLNLLADRYCYQSGATVVGDPASPVRFVDPWQPPPDIELTAAARELRIIERLGCDLAPLDPAKPEDRLTLLSYIWPDELERFNRVRVALSVASKASVRVAARSAVEWLPEALLGARRGELTVIWHSVFRQYMGQAEWDALEGVFLEAVEADPRRSIVWLSMEPSSDQHVHFELTIRTRPDAPARRLASCGDHGPPVSWDRFA